LWRAIWGSSRPLLRDGDAVREQFDREYDALLHETAVSLAEPTGDSSKTPRGT